MEPAAPGAPTREFEAKARALAGPKGYLTSLQACPGGTPITADFVIGACHRLSGIELPVVPTRPLSDYVIGGLSRPARHRSHPSRVRR